MERSTAGFLVGITLILVSIIGLMAINIKNDSDNKKRNELIKKGFEASYSWGYKECSQRLINGELKTTNWDSLYKIDYKKFEQYLEEKLSE